jgi:hypothetical protein
VTISTPSGLWEYITRSTLKREFASLVMGWWMGLGTYLMVRVPVAQMAQDAALQAWGALSLPVFGLAAAAFGTDWISKQTTIAGPPANTETTVKTELTDTTATFTTSSEPKG